jgi:hypothetical protein
MGSGDTLPNRYLPFSLLREHNADLDEFPRLYDEAARREFPVLDGVPYFLQYRHGHYVSAYTPGPAIAALPFYLWPVLSGVPAGSQAAVLEKVSASVITALSVVCLFWALVAVVSPRWALTIAVIYAFGTSSWSVSSQALWQHGPSQLGLTVLLVCLVRGMTDDRWLSWAGFAASAAATMRSTDVLIVVPALVWVLYTHRRRRLRLILLSLPPIAGLLAYQVHYFGLTHGPDAGTAAPVWAFFTQTSSLEGLGGLLLSPGRGLLVYSPVLVFSVVGVLVSLVSGPMLLRSLALGVVFVVILVSHWFRWWGGHAWGPRLLADTTPVLCFLMYPLTETLDRRRVVKALFVLLAACSILVHGLGAFLYDARWDALFDVDVNHAAVWSWRAGPLAFYGREASARIGRALFGGGTPHPNSADSPTLLGAAYRVEPFGGDAEPGGTVRVSLAAKNTGRAVWLARAPGDTGAVRLGWRWSRDAVDVASGRFFLDVDAAPGQTVRFIGSVPVPPVAGDYTLTLDLVSELVTWFAARGVSPVTAAVRVRPMELERLLTVPVGTNESSPTASIGSDRASYRRGEPIHLTVRLLNPNRPGQFDGYLVGQGPGGDVWFSDGRRACRLADCGWVAWSRALPFPAQATGRFTLRSDAFAPGIYQWHVVLTRTGPGHAVARGTTAFTIEP